jgi:hypothetical protein
MSENAVIEMDSNDNPKVEGPLSASKEDCSPEKKKCKDSEEKSVMTEKCHVVVEESTKTCQESITDKSIMNPRSFLMTR